VEAARLAVNSTALKDRGVAANPREHFGRHSRPDAAGVDQLAVVVIIVAEQKRAEMGPRAFGVGPADDNELLAIEALRFAP
jgi:hypothetical protein